MGEIPPIQTDEGSRPHLKPNMNEISPKEPNEVTDLVAMEEGARVQMPDKVIPGRNMDHRVMKTYNKNHHK